MFEGHPFIVEAGVSVGGKDVKQVRYFSFYVPFCKRHGSLTLSLHFCNVTLEFILNVRFSQSVLEQNKNVVLALFPRYEYRKDKFNIADACLL